MNNHIIKKIAFKLDLKKNLEVGKIRSELTGTFQSKIIKELIPYMDEFCDKDEVIRIERLNIDLGTISFDALSAEIAIGIKEELEIQKTKVRAYKAKQDFSNLQSRKDESSIGSVDGISIYNEEKLDENGFKTTTSNRKLDGLIDFLETGSKAWWNPLFNNFEINGYLKELSSENNGLIDKLSANALKIKLSKNENARIRFTALVATSSIDVWLKTWFPNTKIIWSRKNWKPLISITKDLLRISEKEIIKFITLSELNVAFNSSVDLGNSSELIKTLVHEFILNVNKQKGNVLFTKLILVRINELAKHKSNSKKTSQSIILNMLKDEISNVLQQSEKLEISNDEDENTVPSEGAVNELSVKPEKANRNSKTDKSPVSIDADLSQDRNRIEKGIKMNSGEGDDSDQSNEDKDKLSAIKKREVDSEAAEAELLKMNNKNSELEKKENNRENIDDQIEKEKRAEELKTARLVKSLLESNELVETNLKSAFFKTAGVVILWPLIVPLFEDRGLLLDKQFIDKKAQFKGLELLNFAVAGNNPLDEYDMVLNKVLCEIPIEVAVQYEPSLSDEDKDEVENLLNHLITNWSVLKNTSINGLREGFILREAELKEFEEDWLLKVEQKGIDILMNKIPWGFKTVKLPWMSKILSVEW